MARLQWGMSEKKQKTDENYSRNLAIGDRIRALRLQKGYTQAQLSLRLGLSPGACAQWELGYAMPKYEHLERLAVELGSTTEWLMAGEDNEELTKIHTNTERDAITILRAIPSEHHQTALRILKGFIPTDANAKK